MSSVLQVQKGSFYIVTQNPVTGSSSGLIDLEVLGNSGTGQAYCSINFTGANAIYLDGLKRDVSRAITKSIVVRRAGNVIAYSPNDLGRPNDEIHLNAAYNDGNAGGGAVSRSKILKIPLGSGEDSVIWNSGGTDRVIESPSRAIDDWLHELQRPRCIVNISINFDKPYKNSSGNFIVGNYKMTLGWDAYGSGRKVRHSKILTLRVVPEALRAIVATSKPGTISVINGRTLGTAPSMALPFYPIHANFYKGFSLHNSYSPLKDFRGADLITLKSSAVLASRSIPTTHMFNWDNRYTPAQSVLGQIRCQVLSVQT